MGHKNHFHIFLSLSVDCESKHLKVYCVPMNQSVIYIDIYFDFKTEEINLQLEKVSKLQSKISVEKRVTKHL